MKAYFLDLEMNTTSQSIIQIGCAALDTTTGVVEPVVDVVCNPGEEPNAYIQKLTGISVKDVRKGTPLLDALRQLFNALPSREPLFAWGKDFDVIAHASEYYRIHESPLGYPKPATIRARGVDLQDFLRVYQVMTGRKIVSSNSLHKWARHYGVEWEGPQHNAYADAVVTAKVYAAFIKSLG